MDSFVKRPLFWLHACISVIWACSDDIYRTCVMTHFTDPFRNRTSIALFIEVYVWLMKIFVSDPQRYYGIIANYVFTFLSSRWLSPVTLVSSTNKIDRHDIYDWNIVESGVKHNNPNSLIIDDTTVYHTMDNLWNEKKRIYKSFTIQFCKIKQKKEKVIYKKNHKIILPSSINLLFPVNDTELIIIFSNIPRYELNIC